MFSKNVPPIPGRRQSKLPNNWQIALQPKSSGTQDQDPYPLKPVIPVFGFAQQALQICQRSALELKQRENLLAEAAGATLRKGINNRTALKLRQTDAGLVAVGAFLFLNGTSAYPAPDPTVGGGLMAALSPLYPRGPIDVRQWLRPLPETGVPGMPGWTWKETLGHALAPWRLGRSLLP